MNAAGGAVLLGRPRFGSPTIRLLVTAAAVVLIDRGSFLIARGSGAEVDSASLVVEAATRNWLFFGAATACAALLAASGRARVLCRWHEFEQGAQLRLFSGIIVAMLVWRFALYDYNWFAGRWHLLDRGLVIALGVAALLRPVALLPFVVVVRVISDHFTWPLPASSSANIRDFAILAILIIGAVVVVMIATGEHRTDAAPLLLAALIATHFWAGGLHKLRIGWLAKDDLSQLPLNAHAQGWLGHTDGDLARSLSSFLGGAGLLVMLAVLVFELGIAVAIARRSLFRIWLVMAPVFHIVTVALLGFVFLDWVVVEIAVLLLISRSDGDWLDRSWESRRAIAVAAVVVLLPAGVLFHPPRLAWYDTHVVYSYEFEAVTVDGQRLNVDPQDFSPFVEPFAFASLGIGPRIPVIAGYGAATEAARDAVAGVTTIEELERIESGDTPDERRVGVITFLLERFVAKSHADATISLPSAPSEFQSTRPEPSYHNEAIQQLWVYQVTSVRSENGEDVRREEVLVVTNEAEID